MNNSAIYGQIWTIVFTKQDIIFPSGSNFMYVFRLNVLNANQANHLSHHLEIGIED